MKQNLPDYIHSYLNKFSSKKYEIEWEKKSGIENIIVIPTIAELENINTLLSSLLENDAKYFNSTLVLFVINNSTNSSIEVKDENQKSLHYLRSIIFNDLNKKLTNDVQQRGLRVGLVDAASKGKELDEKHSGVGLARKIGMDLALTVFDYEQKSQKLIICLDSDCKVEKNYLAEIVYEFHEYNYSAAVVNYAHNIDGDDKECKAIIPYEILLRYYLEGLRYSGSEYAFHTVGSTMVLNADAYIKAGGMNKRKAAEDFYFLEKVAKNDKIGKINSTMVYPSNRSSWRVPFGTGQRVQRFLNGSHKEYQLFDPTVFDILREWLKLYNSNVKVEPEYTLNCSKEIHSELHDFLIKQNYLEQWKKILKNIKSEKQLVHQKKIWFDAFKTLKLIHDLRDTAFPNINMFDALDMFFVKLEIDNTIIRDGKDIPGLEVQKQYLRVLRKISHEKFIVK